MLKSYLEGLPLAAKRGFRLIKYDNQLDAPRCFTCHIIKLKLAKRRHYAFGDVVYLIRVHNLDVSFEQRLHPTVQ